MAVLYLTAALIVLLANFGEIPAAFVAILDGAFTARGRRRRRDRRADRRLPARRLLQRGGARVGLHRALGRADQDPATEGFVALLEPFIDTIVICTMTALTIIVTQAYLNPDASELGGVALTSDAFETVLPWFPGVLAVAVVLFRSRPC